MGKSTYVAWVDFRKAYDKIPQRLLWDKLVNTYGIKGKMFNAIKSLYNDVQCSVNVNKHLTKWFNVTSGLKQGCLLSTTLFNLFINDLSELLDHSDLGVIINDRCISHMFYADAKHN